MAIALLLCGAVVAHSAGYYPSEANSPAAPPGKLGLAYGGALPEFDFQIPDTRSEAAEEQAVKVGWSWARQLHDGILPRNQVEEAILCARMALTPVGMAGGGTYGALAGESKHKLRPALTALTNALAQLRVQDAPQHELLWRIQQKTTRTITLLTNSFPAETSFRVARLMDVYAPLSPAPSRSPSQSESLCNLPAFEGVDTLLMVRVVNHGLSGLDGYNSKLSLNIAVRATLIRPSDSIQLCGFYVQYDSPPRKFVDWAANGALPFRQEMQTALDSIAEQIVVQSGLRLPPPPQGPMGIVSR